MRICWLGFCSTSAKEKLVDDNGQPNIPVIKGSDRCIAFHELENLIVKIQSGKAQVEKGYAISEMLNTFDMNRDRRIEEDEFIEGCSKWIDEATRLAEKGDSHAADFLREVVQPVSKKRRFEKAEIEHLMARILKHAQSEALDTDGDNIVDEQEFVHGITKWLNKAMDVTKCNDAKRCIDEFDKIMWGEVDNLVYEVGKNENSRLKVLSWSFSKSIFEVMLGVAILTFLSGPLKTSIQKFSHAIGLPAFFISFAVVPIFLNALSAISAIFPASQKSSRTSSLTFCEIYGGVVMNNIMGLTTLLAIVYIKGLKWDYSAEVLTIMVVCLIVGILAYSQTTYPLWTCLLAFFLYPFSLLMYYAFQYALGWG